MGRSTLCSLSVLWETVFFLMLSWALVGSSRSNLSIIGSWVRLIAITLTAIYRYWRINSVSDRNLDIQLMSNTFLKEFILPCLPKNGPWILSFRVICLFFSHCNVLYLIYLVRLARSHGLWLLSFPAESSPTLFACSLHSPTHVSLVDKCSKIFPTLGPSSMLFSLSWNVLMLLMPPHKHTLIFVWMLHSRMQVFLSVLLLLYLEQL